MYTNEIIHCRPFGSECLRVHRVHGVVNPAIFVNMPHVFTRKCDFHLQTCRWFLETKDAHTKRAILAPSLAAMRTQSMLETPCKKGVRP